MRQIKRFPIRRAYKFGLGIGERFGGLTVESGDFITEEDVKKYEVGEKFLEPIGTEKENWDSEIPENTDIVMFNIEVEVSGGDREERKRMINQFEREFQDHVQQKGEAILKVIGVRVIRKKKKKSNR